MQAISNTSCEEEQVLALNLVLLVLTCVQELEERQQLYDDWLKELLAWCNSYNIDCVECKRKESEGSS